MNRAASVFMGKHACMDVLFPFELPAEPVSGIAVDTVDRLKIILPETRQPQVALEHIRMFDAVAKRILRVHVPSQCSMACNRLTYQCKTTYDQ